MSHLFSECGYTVVQLFGLRLQIVDRARNPIISSRQFPVYQPKEFRIGKYSISLTRV